MWRANLLSNIASIGPKDLDLLYDYDWAGDSTQVLTDLLKGKGELADRLKAAKKPIVILGQQVLKGGESSNAYELTQSVCDKYKAQLNVLHSNASQVAAMDLGFRPSSEFVPADSDDQKLLWLFGVDDTQLTIPNNTFTIYTGHNGDAGVEKADVVLPGAAFTEKQAIYANLEGRAQQTLKAITPPVQAREDWKIIRACSELVNRTLPYDNLSSIRQRMFELSPNLAEPSYVRLHPAIDAVRDGKAATNVGSSVKLNTKLKHLVDYYQTDSISRSSPTMAKCIVTVQKELDKRAAK
jgi:NADH dehydrogenase (ubiquinone) Fe-S protein 1